jgi:hypothetical protein
MVGFQASGDSSFVELVRPAYDLTPALQPGANLIQIVVMNGEEPGKPHFQNPWALIFAGSIDYEVGTGGQGGDCYCVIWHDPTNHPKQPEDNPDILVVKAGSNIPIKFHLCDDSTDPHTLVIDDSLVVTAVVELWDPDTNTWVPQATFATGDGSLKWAAGNGMYHTAGDFKTPKLGKTDPVSQYRIVVWVEGCDEPLDILRFDSAPSDSDRGAK